MQPLGKGVDVLSGRAGTEPMLRYRSLKVRVEHDASLGEGGGIMRSSTQKARVQYQAASMDWATARFASDVGLRITAVSA